MHQLPYNITIGNYQYNYFYTSNDKFDWEFSMINNTRITYSNMPYPLIKDTFQGAINLSTKSLNYLIIKGDSDKAKETIQNIENIINYLALSESEAKFKIDYGISIINNNQAQIIIIWNSSKTYMMLNFPNQNSGIFNIKLGRNINGYKFIDDIPKTKQTDDQLIYEISTNRIIKIGCQALSSQNNTNIKKVLPLSMSKYLLSSLGGEMIFLQGPCIDNQTIADSLILEIKRHSNNKTISIPKTYNSKTNSFAIITPFLWYSGIYEFKITLENVDFIAEVEIYGYDSPHQLFSFQWIESSQMNNPNFQKSEINFKTLDSLTLMKSYFIVLDLSKTDQNTPIILKETITNRYKNDNLIINLDDLKFDIINIYKHIGLFAFVDDTKLTKWTKPFSLIWLKKNMPKSSDENICKSYLKPIKIPKTNSCPDNSEKAKGMLSTFRKLEFSLNGLMDELNEQDCFHEIIPRDQGDPVRVNGVTCCYFKETGYLVYGEDFYLRNKTIFGSYIWTISPHYNLLKHFIVDRIPTLSCCLLSNNDTLCSQYWIESQNITISNNAKDLRGDIFGDPHFVPFNAESHYSFLGLGQYRIITSNNNEFTLLGRFFHEHEQSSLLKAIAIITLSLSIVITRSSNGITDLTWKILINQTNSEILTLPFIRENIMITQFKNSNKLYIYMKLENYQRIHIELERFFYFDKLLEYINMQIHLSSDTQEIINGGLFGRPDTRNTGLFEEFSKDFIEKNSLTVLRDMYKFSLSWQLKPENKTLFFDMDFNKIPESFRSKSINTYKECEMEMCKIDKTMYENENIFQETVNAYKARIILDKDWISGNSKPKACDHPYWKFIKLSSSNFMVGETINITECLDPSMKMEKNYQIIICQLDKNGGAKWQGNPPVEGELCKNPSKTDPERIDSKNDLFMYIGIGVSALILIILCLIILFIVIKRRQKNKIVSRSNLEMNLKLNVKMSDIYENNATNFADDLNYATYAEINKQVNN